MPSHGGNLARKQPAIPDNSRKASCGDAPKQLEIRWSLRDVLERAWHGIDDGRLSVADLVREFVKVTTLKEVAHLLDERESSLAHELAERDYHEPSARLMLLAILGDDDNALLRELCRLKGGDFVARPTLTPEEENRRLRASLAKAGPAGAAILEDALGAGR